MTDKATCGAQLEPVFDGETTPPCTMLPGHGGGWHANGHRTWPVRRDEPEMYPSVPAYGGFAGLDQGSTVRPGLPPEGMTSLALAQYVEEFIHGATERVCGVGHDQYDQGADGQRFEHMNLLELMDWADEELQDVAVYAAMLSIRVRRMRLEFERRGLL